jgi:hypothetical protein
MMIKLISRKVAKAQKKTQDFIELFLLVAPWREKDFVGFIQRSPNV